MEEALALEVLVAALDQHPVFGPMVVKPADRAEVVEQLGFGVVERGDERGHVGALDRAHHVREVVRVRRQGRRRERIVEVVGVLLAHEGVRGAIQFVGNPGMFGVLRVGDGHGRRARCTGAPDAVP